MNNTLMMAFAKGQESKEVSIKRYIGVAPVFVKAVNPTKTELEKLYGITLDNDPTYFGDSTMPDGSKVPQVRIDFIVATNPEKSNGIELTSKVSFFIENTIRTNSQNTKVQMVNKYGEFFWLTMQEAEAGAVSTSNVIYSTLGMRRAYRGEEALTEFLKNFLVIPNSTYLDQNTKQWLPIKNLSEAEAQLGYINNYFKGDFSELKDIIGSQPTNQIKICFGIKTTDDNKQYQDVFTRKTLRLRVNDYSKLDAEIQSAKENGAYSKTEFSIEPIHEYQVEATTFTQQEPTAVPQQPDWYK